MGRPGLNSNSITLKRINYKDADKILTLYTSELGKVSAIAKGVRKISSKKTSSLELFTLSKIHLIESFGMYMVGQTSSLKSFTNIKSNYDKIALGLYMLEIFDKLVPENQPNKTLFKFLVKSINFLNLSSSRTLYIVNAYNIKLLRMLGFYSADELKSYNLIELANSLETKTYEEIIKLSINKEHNKELRNILINLTETIAESSIKSSKSL